MKRFLLTIACLAMLVATTGQVQAGVITYTNKAAFQLAAGATAVEDFTGTSGNAIGFDNGDFSISIVNQNLGYVPVFFGEELRLQLWRFDTVTNLTFADPIHAIGFDWRNTDPTNDQIELIIASENFAQTFGPAQQSGFFGIVSTNAFTVVGLSDTVGNGGALGYGYVDNIEYSSAAAVPEPASLAIFGIGALGLVVFRRRRKVKLDLL
ncbi:PEP-CTERM motif protein [Roseimaritima multifibrata]|uniref:PEP-CTERM motif protein n=1 Tax=Roseimaritima multifibrata TaxID=1930274 RepID=A0A517MH41_9BACT|nr:PEP-CTERM sorting domain-containing protein [Roseimaritima multifibrata]QDS94203.1 PEP-CTERM motif protein [Roseimaritima multifibrata]